MSISKTLQRPVAFAATGKDFKNSDLRDRIITSSIVIAVLLVISTVVWISTEKENINDAGNAINVNIIHDANRVIPSETAAEEYIEYEMPDISF